MGHWIYYNSPTIQAVCAILALIGLTIYAWDTQQIRRATMAQSDASRRPFFELVPALGRDKILEVLRLRNSGVGVALNVAWQPIGFHQSKLKPRALSCIAPGGILHVLYKDHELTFATLKSMRGITVTYTDTAGKEYFTMFPVTPWDEVRVVTLSEASSRLARSANRGYRSGTDSNW